MVNTFVTVELLNEKSYPLNKSRSKNISIGLCKYNLQPSITITGLKQKVVLSEDSWKRFMFYKPMLTSYFNEDGLKFSTVYDVFTIEFHNFKNKKLIKLYQVKETWVYLGGETITGLWGLTDLINAYFSVLHKHTFDIFYSDIIKNNVNLLENQDNIMKFINMETDGIKAYTLMEMAHFFPEKIIVDVEIANAVKL